MKGFWILVAVVAALVVAEFAILIEVGRRMGTLLTLLIVFGTGLAGVYLARMEGFRILDRMRRDLGAGLVPANQIFDGFLVLVAGLLLLVPGLVTDIAGLALLFPPTRFVVKVWMIRRFRRSMASRRIQVTPRQV